MDNWFRNIFHAIAVLIVFHAANKKTVRNKIKTREQNKGRKFKSLLLSPIHLAHHRSTVEPLLLRCRTDITTLSLCCRSAFAPLWHRCHSAVAPLLLCCCTSIAPVSHRYRSTVAPLLSLLLSLRSRTAIAPLSRCCRTAIAPAQRGYYWSPTFCRYQRGGSTCTYTYTEVRRRPDDGHRTIKR